MNLKKLKRELLAQNVNRQPLNVAILCGASPGTLPDCLEIELLKSGFLPQIWVGDYARYYEDALFGINDFIPNVVYIYTTRHNIQHTPRFTDSTAAVEEMLDTEAARIGSMHTALKNRFGCVVIQNNFDLPAVLPAVNLETSDPRGIVRYTTELNRRLSDCKDAYIFDLAYFTARYGLCKVHNPAYMHLFKYAISVEAEGELARSVASLVRAIYGRRGKVLVCDLDGTLWGGVVGDDGVESIEIGDTPKGEEFQLFQRFISRLRDSGILLCVATKNEPEAARSGFSARGSVLSIDDFVQIEAGWHPKPNSLRRMAEQLNLGLDSFVFVDDNPAERELMRQSLPEVATIEADTPQAMMEEICRLGLFDAARLSAEDTARSQQYISETSRRKAVSSFENYDEYLLSLGMTAEFSPINSTNLSRTSQLINKTNQFNLTTLRLNEAQVADYAGDEGCVTLTARLCDKFGDNGLVAALFGRVVQYTEGVWQPAQRRPQNIVQNAELRALEIELWVMSCRVFSRELEYAMLDELVRICKDLYISELHGVYIPTAKNKPVEDLYSRMKFELSGSAGGTTRWRLKLDGYENRTAVMEVKHCE